MSRPGTPGGAIEYEPGCLKSLIESTLRELADEGCCLIVTTGGTGQAARDVTLEATEVVCENGAGLWGADAKCFAR